jgi:hypothetical protein
VSCPDLEILFQQLVDGEGSALDHAAGCPHCSAMLEEHRQLEKDLYRLADPLPPPDFVHQVMAKVAASPQPRSELLSGVVVLALASAAMAFCAAASGHLSLGGLGVSFATTVVQADTAFGAFSRVVQVVWSAAAVPLALGITLVLFAALGGMRRLLSSPLSDAHAAKVP